ncbi:aspartyl/asparaginyl beta-hydroxylase domain-containing protein [Pseudomonas sp. SIMBA_077]
MNSTIIGTFNHTLISESECKTISDFSHENNSYSEFRIGDWKTYVIRSASGENEDGLISSSSNKAIITPRGHALPLLNSWIDSMFDTSKLRLARIHSLGAGVLIPHRDFLELGPKIPTWKRVHIPIKTNTQCFHSEEDTVFRMRPGEIWLFDASRLHSAVNFSERQRLNLCLDFELGDEPTCSLLRNGLHHGTLYSPDIIQRPPLNDEFYQSLMGMSACLNEMNFRDVIGLLSKVHFYRRATLSEFFDWLLEITTRSGNETLKYKAIAFTRFLRAERSMSERFFL